MCDFFSSLGKEIAQMATKVREWTTSTPIIASPPGDMA